MNASSYKPAFALAVAGMLAICWTLDTRAESPYERDQRQQMERAQQAGTLSPDAQKMLRWQQEWRQKHPGEPMPNAGRLEKMHRDEITATMNQDWANRRALRQEQLKRNYLMARQMQARQLARQRITWTPQQWKQWDEEYVAQQKQDAQDYLKAWAQMGEMARQEKEREEQEKLWKRKED